MDEDRAFGVGRARVTYGRNLPVSRPSPAVAGFADPQCRLAWRVFFRLVPPVRMTDVTLQEAIERLARQVGYGHPLGGIPAGKPLSIDLPQGTVLDFANAILRAHAELTWTLEPEPPLDGRRMVLAAVGVYGVMAYSVRERTQEIGVRMALGATATSVFRLVLGQALRLAFIGVVTGLVAAVGLTRLLERLLFEVGPLDPWTFGATAFILYAVATVASYMPARRGMQMAPVDALRTN
jgi:FtsX-like permease family